MFAVFQFSHLQVWFFTNKTVKFDIIKGPLFSPSVEEKLCICLFKSATLYLNQNEDKAYLYKC